MAYVVALSGGIASGKSAVTDRLVELAVEVVDADQVSRDVIAPGTPALAEIVAHFGREVLRPDGGLDRRAMRKRVFADDASRRALEGIIHPRVRTALRQSASASRADVLVLAIPLLVESGSYDWVDRTVMVDAHTATQRARLMLRDQIDRQLADQMISAQAPRSRRLAIADEVIANDASLASLHQQVDSALARWRFAGITRTR